MTMNTDKIDAQVTLRVAALRYAKLHAQFIDQHAQRTCAEESTLVVDLEQAAEALYAAAYHLNRVR